MLISLMVPAQTNSSIRTDTVSSRVHFNDEKIEILSLLLLEDTPDSEKDSINDKLKVLLSKELVKKKAFSHPFDKIKSLTILTPNDSAFRIFNWSIPHQDGTFHYECALLLRKEGESNNHLIFLTSSKELNPNEEKITRGASNWMGALYYKLIEKETSLNRYYTLLAWDGNNLLTNKKYIDVLWFNNNGEVKFGAPIFESPKETRSRIVFEFGGQHAMKLSYDDKADRIIFDYLVPLNSRLEGIYEYYYPDVTQDAYVWEGKSWVFHKLADGDESLKKSKKSFPIYTKEKIQEQKPVYSPK